MRKLILLGLCLLVSSGCSTSPPKKKAKRSPVSGRELVLQALKPEDKETRACSCLGGVFTTAYSSISLNPANPLKRFDPEDEENKDRSFSIRLHDGTKVGGLFFEYADENGGPKPLLIASFGFLQDRWGTEAVKFFELYLEDGAERIPAHVLILDHPTGGPFMANNGHLSMGSYDDARMWIEIAQDLQSNSDVSDIHLFGVSMSGHGGPRSHRRQAIRPGSIRLWNSSLHRAGFSKGAG